MPAGLLSQFRPSEVTAQAYTLFLWAWLIGSSRQVSGFLIQSKFVGWLSGRQLTWETRPDFSRGCLHMYHAIAFSILRSISSSMQLLICSQHQGQCAFATHPARRTVKRSFFAEKRSADSKAVRTPMHPAEVPRMCSASVAGAVAEGGR